MTRAYNGIYLDSAQDILGHAFDWVANTCCDDLALFCDRFSQSRVSSLFESGHPRYIAGCNGAELVNWVMEDLNLDDYGEPHEFYADRSPEYWVGWVLAYFQWSRNLAFNLIFKRIPLERILDLYPLGHEQDVRNVADTLSAWMDKPA